MYFHYFQYCGAFRVAARLRETRHHLCSSSALHVCVCGTALPLCRRLARAVGRGRPLPLERSNSRARTRLGGRRFALAHSGTGDHRAREDGMAPPLQRRKSQSYER